MSRSSFKFITLFYFSSTRLYTCRIVTLHTKLAMNQGKNQAERVQKRFNLGHRSWASSSGLGSLPMSLATTGVRATVGGNLTGESALWAA